MLTLSRYERQKVILTLPSGELITIVVVEASGGKCRLGITAPDNVVIDREEIHLAKKEERP